MSTPDPKPSTTIELHHAEVQSALAALTKALAGTALTTTAAEEKPPSPTPARHPFARKHPVALGGLLFILTLVIGSASWFLPAGINWLVTLALMGVFFLAAGKAITGRTLGVLISERKTMSLSRLQLVIWTAMIVSGFFVIAMERIHSGEVAQPLAIAIDWQIWTLLGISTASFIGTPLIHGVKKATEPKDKAAAAKEAGKNLTEDEHEVARNSRGLLYCNESHHDARFTDMFEGEELGNTHLVDVGKVQMFFFTTVVAIAYGTQLYQLIAYGDLNLDNVQMPALQDGLLALLGVSNAGYLGAKGVHQTPTSKKS